MDEVYPEEKPDLQFPHANITPINAISQTLSSTYGPLSFDKLLLQKAENTKEYNQDFVKAIDHLTISSDGQTILQEMAVSHPVGRILRSIGGPVRPGDTKVEGNDITDGTTTAVLLTSALLERGEKLIDKGVHPSVICDGYQAGLQLAQECFSRNTQVVNGDIDDEKLDKNIAQTAFTGYTSGMDSHWFAQLAVKIAKEIRVPTPDTLMVKGVRSGSISQSSFVSGSIISQTEKVNTRMPNEVTNARVLLLSGQSEGGLRKPQLEGKNMKLETSSPEVWNSFEVVSADDRQRLVEKLTSMDIQLVVAQQGIDKYYGELLAKNGILAYDGVTSSEIKHIAKSTGAVPVQKMNGFSMSDLGFAGFVKERIIGEEYHRKKSMHLVTIEDCTDPDAVSIIIRGLPRRLSDEYGINIRKAVYAISVARGATKHKKGIIPGGGAIEMEVSKQIRERANSIGSKEQLALLEFAVAVERLVHTLADNAGIDPLKAVSDLHNEHKEGAIAGLILPEKRIDDPIKCGVIDPVGTKLKAYNAAVDVANMVLNIDDALDAKLKQTPPDTDNVIFEEPAEQQIDHSR